MQEIKLDGSYGLGVDAEVIIYTKDVDTGGARKEVSYRFPYGIICFDQLTEALKVGLIQGFSIEKLGVQPMVMIERPDEHD